MKDDIFIHWFRQDLRLNDNPALLACAAEGSLILPLYILDDQNAGSWAMGSASKWWLHHSLISLDRQLTGRLTVAKGPALEIIPLICQQFGVSTVTYNRCYEPHHVSQDKSLELKLASLGVKMQSFNGSLLWEPWEIKTKSDEPYRVFTPFYRFGCLNAAPQRVPFKAPEMKYFCLENKVQNGVVSSQLNEFGFSFERSTKKIDNLSLLADHKWHHKLSKQWEIGETAALGKLDQLIKRQLSDYAHGRDFPARNVTSRLSPHLHFGEISPNQIWHRLKAHKTKIERESLNRFCAELGWREFCHSLLYFNPDMPQSPIQKKFLCMSWNNDAKALRAWQHGKTGVPLVDAGMRELWQTGYMHNRVRMITASFLVKNLRIDWKYGEEWFWDCLVDADLANNSGGWQWVAGCGVDAAPYYRIFNPVLQAQKFDPQGEYIRQFVPELARLEGKDIFAPWQAPLERLERAGVKLGDNYPFPIVDLAQSRKAALDAFNQCSII